MNAGQSRRDFIRFSGLGVSLGMACAFKTATGASDLLRTIRDRFWLTTHLPLIKRFHEARMGALMYYYQHFFPTFVNRDSLQKIEQLYALCQAKINSKTDERWHRIYILPAVAAAHILTSLEEHDAH